MRTAGQQPERNEQDKDAYIKQHNSFITSAIEKAKAKDARLRLMKERNENYLAERAEQIYEDEL
jgi:hypothetical protein